MSFHLPHVPYQPPVTPPAPEEFLGQIFADGHWVDYARSTEAEAREWQAKNPARRRVVDWIDKETIKINSTCPSTGHGLVDHIAFKQEKSGHGVMTYSCDACGYSIVD